MKTRIIILLIVGLLLLTIPAFANTTPLEVYKNFLTAISQGDLNKARECVTEEVCNSIDKSSPEEQKEEIAKLQKLVPKKLSVLNEKIDNDTCKLWVNGVIYNPQKQKEILSWGEISFFKENGNWKILGMEWDVSGTYQEHPGLTSN